MIEKRKERLKVFFLSRVNPIQNIISTHASTSLFYNQGHAYSANFICIVAVKFTLHMLLYALVRE